MDLQNQIYILAGVFGGVSLLLLMFVCYLMFSLFEMHNLLKSRNRSDSRDPRDPRSRNDYAYANPSIVAGEELNRRGYQMHDLNDTNQSDFAPSGLAAAGANRFRTQMSTDAGTKDASRDFSSILNNDAMVFGGSDNRSSGRRSRSIPAPPPPLGKPSNYNDNISFPAAPMNPLGHRQERGYFNRGGGY